MVCRLPYQLNADAPYEGFNKLQYYNDRFGPARVAQMVPAMEVRVTQDDACCCCTELVAVSKLDCFSHVPQPHMLCCKTTAV